MHNVSMATQVKVAVLMACHNRCDRTLACLTALYASAQQIRARNFQVDVFLTDDATAQMVQRKFPQVHVLRGDGQLYWNGGMRKAFSAADQTTPDFYLWLNDDTTLYPEALTLLIGQAESLIKSGHLPIVVGSVLDPSTAQVSYGGVRQHSYIRGKFRLVAPLEKAQRCSTMNGNCVLFPRAVREKVGDLDPAFAHGAGDFDYGLRATSQGCSVWVAPGVVGLCTINPAGRTWLAVDLSLMERMRRISSPKGLPPKPWLVFTRRHTGLFWPVYWSYPYLRLLVRHFALSLRFRRMRANTRKRAR
jgi:GT2 family glycosyltransferase